MTRFGSIGAIISAVCAIGLLFGITAAGASAEVACKSGAVICPTGDAYPVGTKVEAQLVPNQVIVMRYGSITEFCHGSRIKAELTHVGENKFIEASVSESSMYECNKAWKPEALGSMKIGILSGDLSGVSRPGFLLNGQGTTGWNCTFKSPVYTLESGAPARLFYPSGSALKYVSGVNCPAEIKIEAEYEVTAPSPLYIRGG